jgi:hypothetical protein
MKSRLNFNISEVNESSNSKEASLKKVNLPTYQYWCWFILDSLIEISHWKVVNTKEA